MEIILQYKAKMIQKARNLFLSRYFYHKENIVDIRCDEQIALYDTEIMKIVNEK
jgi:hypothetical protein